MNTHIDPRFLLRILASELQFTLKDGNNPFLITHEDKDVWLYIQTVLPNISKNKDLMQLNIPDKKVFEVCMNSSNPLIMLGYDDEFCVYSTWNPEVVRKRIQVENFTFLTRKSLEEETEKEEGILCFPNKETHDKVVCFPLEKVSEVFHQISNIFGNTAMVVLDGKKSTKASRLVDSASKWKELCSVLDLSSYIPQNNENFNRLVDLGNIEGFKQYLRQGGYGVGSVNRYARMIRIFINDNIFARYRFLYDVCKNFSECHTASVIMFEQDMSALLGKPVSSAHTSPVYSYIEYLSMVFDYNIVQPVSKWSPIREYLRLDKLEIIQRLSLRFGVQLISQSDEEELNEHLKAIKENEAYRFIMSPKVLASFRDFLKHNKKHSLKSTASFMSRITRFQNDTIFGLFRSMFRKCYSLAEASELVETIFDMKEWRALSEHYAFNTYLRTYIRFLCFAKGNQILYNDDNSIPTDSAETNCSNPSEADVPIYAYKEGVIVVTLPDGRVLQNRNNSRTVLEMINEYGLDYVLEMNIKVHGHPFITPSKEYDRQVKIWDSGYYADLNITIKEKADVIRQMARELDEEISVEIYNSLALYEKLLSISNYFERPLEAYQKIVWAGSNNVEYREDETGNKVPVNETSTDKIRVIFPDGRDICPKNPRVALLEVIKYAGVERVWKLDLKAQATIHGMSLISDMFQPVYRESIYTFYISNPQDNKTPKQLYAYFIGTTQEKFSLINTISKSLEINLSASIIKGSASEKPEVQPE